MGFLVCVWLVGCWFIIVVVLGFYVCSFVKAGSGALSSYFNIADCSASAAI